MGQNEILAAMRGRWFIIPMEGEPQVLMLLCYPCVSLRVILCSVPPSERNEMCNVTGRFTDEPSHSLNGGHGTV